MPSRNPSVVARYAFTISAVTIATLLRFALDPVLDLQVPFILFFPTVVLCAWFGGLRQGLLSTALGGIIAWYIFIPPQFSFKASDPTAPAQLIVFLIAGTCISLMAESLHQTRRRTEESEAREREQRERLRVTLSSIGDGVIATDAKGRVTFINQVAQSLTGWRQEEASGKPLESVFNIVNEETRKTVENPALRAMKEGVVVGLANHTVLIARDGSELAIDDSGAPIKSSDGKTMGAVLIFRDISERRRAERERALLAHIIESSEDAIIGKNLDGIIEAWNAAAERMYGYSASEAIGQPIAIIIPPEKIEEEQAILERLRRGERIEHFETVRQSKSGRRVAISLTVSPIRDAYGRIIGASKIARDITERNRTQQELIESRERLRMAMEASQMGTWTRELDESNRTRWSPELERIFGLEPGEFPETEEAFFDFVHSDDRNLLARAVAEAIENHTDYAIEFRYLRKGETEFRWMAGRGRAFYDADGRPFRLAGFGWDITERKQSEQALRAREAELEVIINRTPFMLTRCSRDLRYGFVSRAYAEMIGRQPEEIAGQPIVEIMGEEGFQTIFPHIEKVLSGSRVEYQSEVPFQKVGVRSLHVVYTPDVDERGSVQGWIASILDVTERKRAEQEVRNLSADLQRQLDEMNILREQAEAANRAKDEFVAVVSHEIRSPLNAILGWAQMLRTGKFNQAETARAIEVIERNARMQVQIIEDLLDISRVTTGKLTLDIRPVEPAQIIESVIETIRPAAEAKAIQLQVHLEPKGSLISGDPNRLQQIVWNLLSNAVKFTPKDGRIEVRVERIDSQLQITVSDSGAGISPEFLPFVFDRFSQASTGSERKYGGLGLGLSIVRHLVELHGGTVRADSLGEGQG
ncbi:MAG TPA: PAS domain S-box protein, partial [Blastocatellia bacterium]